MVNGAIRNSSNSTAKNSNVREVELDLEVIEMEINNNSTKGLEITTMEAVAAMLAGVTAEAIMRVPTTAVTIKETVVRKGGT